MKTEIVTAAATVIIAIPPFKNRIFQTIYI